MTKHKSPAVRPAGLRSVPFLNRQREEQLLREISGFQGAWSHPQPVRCFPPALRSMLCFGWHYASESRSCAPAAAFPDALVRLRDDAVAAAGLGPAASFAQAIVTQYPVGAGIGWHTDASVFGPEILIVSLQGPGVLEFAHRDAPWQYELPVVRGSLTVLAGVARTAWKHRLKAVPSPRVSITFRTLAVGV